MIKKNCRYIELILRQCFKLCIKYTSNIKIVTKSLSFYEKEKDSEIIHFFIIIICQMYNILKQK